MNKFLKICIVFVVGFFIISCEKDEDQAVITETTKSKITPDKTTIVLDKNNPDNAALNIIWNKSAFNLPVAYTQQLQFGIKGENFKTSSTVDAISSPSVFTHKQLNSIALSLGAVPNAVTEIEVRLRTLVGAGPFYSNVVTLIVTPYLLGPVYSYTDLYLIGNATAAGWTNDANNPNFLPLQKTNTSGAYSYTGYFAQGAFKIIKDRGSWDPQYGMGGPGVLSASGGDISVATSGYYKLSINITALTYSLVSISAPSTTYTNISMIGTASGDWNTDVDLQKTTFDPHIWVKKNVAMNSGEFKFRANHDWATSWGVAQEFFGIADIGGANIPLTTAFKYDVYFNDITGEYSAIPVLN